MSPMQRSTFQNGQNIGINHQHFHSSNDSILFLRGKNYHNNQRLPCELFFFTSFRHYSILFPNFVLNKINLN